MKRSLGPSRWFLVQDHDTPKVPKMAPLCEGPVVGKTPASMETTEKTEAEPKPLKPYQRGNLDLALQEITEDSSKCFDHIQQNVKSKNSIGPYKSRENAWETLAIRAGFTEPFHLSPDLIFMVMGALDRAGYRSSELYLDTAKQAHIQRGFPWTSQLAQAAKQAKRACQRHRGPAKQAQPLPLPQLGALNDEEEPLAKGGPYHPIRSTILMSWWLLREIEASNAKVDDIRIDSTAMLVHWRLPSSKTDWQGLGSTRTHACCCDCGTSPQICPYHAMSAQAKWATDHKSEFLFSTLGKAKVTKAGWADTFQQIAMKLHLETQDTSGNRRFTGHTARATGAIHMANTQVELWRIQLFGRWGSDCFKRYVRDAPLTQLHRLAQETTMRCSIMTAKAELSSLLLQVENLQMAKSAVQKQPLECLADCEAAGDLVPPNPNQAAPSFVINESTRGKVHRIAKSGTHIPHFMWHTRCFWYFARHGADYTLVDEPPVDRSECAKCFQHPKRPRDDESYSSSSSSSSEWCARKLGMVGIIKFSKESFVVTEFQQQSWG